MYTIEDQIIPEGKHRGMTLEELASNRWAAKRLMRESWFRAKYPDLYYDLEVLLASPSLYRSAGLYY